MSFLRAAIAVVFAAASAAAQHPVDSIKAHSPFRIFGNAYYVGTADLGSILITSAGGHVLIDGGLPASAAEIARNIEILGFDLRDVKMILNSHAHFDHAGGIAELQRRSGAAVAALPWSARVIEAGRPARDDPQFGVLSDFPAATNVKVINDGDTVRVGTLALVAHRTAGHTPTGTTWTWRSCDAGRCLDLVYADSQTPISADGFYYTRSSTYSTGVQDFRRGFDTLEGLRCDILLTPHPGASNMWERIARRDRGEADALVDAGACRRYAATGREQLARRIEKEKR